MTTQSYIIEGYTLYAVLKLARHMQLKPKSTYVITEFWDYTPVVYRLYYIRNSKAVAGFVYRTFDHNRRLTIILPQTDAEGYLHASTRKKLKITSIGLKLIET